MRKGNLISEFGRLTQVATFFGGSLFSLMVHAQVQVEDTKIRLCEHITIVSPEEISFSEDERRLICGDSDNPGWKTIPLHQASYMIRRALEERGYLQPTFESAAEKIVVRTGKKTLVEGIRVFGSPFDLAIERYWQPIGRPLTPKLIDEVEAWVRQQLGFEGFPCAKLESKASRVDGYIIVSIEPGSHWKVGYLKSETIPGTLGGVEARWNAFHLGDEYSEKRLEISSRRLVEHDLVLTNHFTPLCDSGEQGVIQQTLTPGKPRLVSFAFGFDTEEYAIAQASWQNGLLLSSASRLRTDLSLSYIRQEAAAVFDWYYLPFRSRHYLELTASVSRTNERRYEERRSKLSSLATWQNDIYDMHYQFKVGPAYSFLTTTRGISQDISRIVSLDTEVQLKTHDFEYYSSSPQSGHQVTLSNSSSNTNLGSSLSASLWEAQTTSIFNLGKLSPPVFIGIFRTELASTEIGEDTEATDLPPSYRHYLGGVNDLRGFGRKSIPPNDLGALTKLYAGLDLRLNNVLPYKLQPFIFCDYGLLGDVSMKLNDEQRYWSPGAGLRWESPVGALKLSIGHGIIDGPEKERLEHLSRWQFYFSFGDQF